MASIGDTTRPAFAYDEATDTWVPVGVGPHSHTPAAIGAISSSIVTAKGNIVTGTGSGLVSVTPVGNNGEVLIADSSTATGLRYQVPVNSNPVLNSAFDIAQRGTTFSSIQFGTYTLDRWQGFRASSAFYSVSQQATGDTTNLPFIRYCARVGRPSGNTALDPVLFFQTFETANSIPYAGKTVTISFYARKGANYSSASDALTVDIRTGTGIDQNRLSFTGSSSAFSGLVTLTTTWQRFSVTGSIGATITEFAPQFNYTPVGTAGAADYFEVTGVQLEVGSVATPFKTIGTYQQELAACQRYYTRFTGAASTAVLGINGFAASTTIAIFNLMFPVQMRSAPTALDFNNLAFYNFRTAATLSGGTFVRWQGYPSTIQLRYTHGSAVFAINDQIDIVGAAAADTYIGLSAEL